MEDHSSMKRRLAAILAADIAGYSRLMHEDEASTVRDLKAHQSVVLPRIARHVWPGRFSGGSGRLRAKWPLRQPRHQGR